MNTQDKGTFRLGTSGIVVPGSKHTFPPQFQAASRLTYYASLFNTLEVNSTFKKLPKTTTLQKWSNEVSDDFEFTIKLWNQVTHVKKLQTDLQNIETFFNIINSMQGKKGCLLVQFPGSITNDYFDEVAKILGKLNEVSGPSGWRTAVEFRHESWYNPETFLMLEANNAVNVLHDMPKSKYLDYSQPCPFTYIRFHGPKGDYRGSYSNDFLQEQATQIVHNLNQKKDVYAYFNNTMGNAYENAMYLKGLVQKSNTGP